jgi:DNA-binding NarL/FixJ family response regulator
MSRLGASMRIRDLYELTPAEKRFIELFDKGMSRREIADHLGLKHTTVTNMLRKALDKRLNNALLEKSA